MTPPAPHNLEANDLLVLYDGVCALCNGLVRFCCKRDARDRLRFTPLQGPLARDVVAQHGFDPDRLDTVYLVLGPGTDEERVMVRGRAALKIVRSCGGAWRLLAVFALLPTFVLDFGYRIIARSRYRAFGRYDNCPIPPAEHRHRFIE